MQKKTSKDSQITKKGSIAESFIVSFLSALGFIAWGLWVNWDHGISSRIQVGVTQGGISFVSTYTHTELLRYFAGKGWKWLKTGSVAWVVMYSMIASVHWLAGTPELLATMSLGMLMGMGFSLGYAKRLC